MMVTTEEAAASANNGNFSMMSARTPRASRPNGHTSRSIRVSGSDTSMGLDARPTAKHTRTAPYVITRGRRVYRSQSHVVAHQKTVLRTSLRSAIQATDSTWAGCTANNAATHALRQTAPVMSSNNPNNSNVASACHATFIRWWAPASMPNRVTSS